MLEHTPRPPPPILAIGEKDVKEKKWKEEERWRENWIQKVNINAEEPKIPAWG